MRLVIPAAGQGVRWRHYHQDRVEDEQAGWWKHLARVGGETVIGRLVRLFVERGVDDVWIVGPDHDGYRIEGTRLFTPVQVPEHYDANKLLNSSELWEGRTAVMYGDVYLTEDAADRIVADSRPWVAVGRSRPHRWTGGSEEIFGFILDSEYHDRARKTLRDIARLRHGGEIPRAAGWEFYWASSGDVRAWRTFSDTWLEIDDLTDDVDTREQWESLCAVVDSGCVPFVEVGEVVPTGGFIGASTRPRR